MGVCAAQHVAAKAERIVTNAQLAEERGRQVGLVADTVNAAGLANSPSRPYHRNVALARVGVVDAGRISDTVVGQDDDQSVFPLARFLKLRHEAADAIVEIGESIGHGVVLDAAVRHAPRFVARQGEETRVPGPVGRFFLYHLEETTESDMVGHAPIVRMAFLFGKRGVAKSAFVTR